MKNMRQRLTCIAAAVALILMLSCGSAFAGVPSVSDDFYVADYAKVIDSTTEDYIIEQNIALENLCGAQIVVAAVDFLDGMDIEDYAYKMFNSWEIGDASEDNGVLLLLVIGEENYWCVQGTGLENVLTSGEISDILWDYLEDDFAAGDYSDGVRKTFDRLYDVVYDYYEDSSYAGGYADSEYVGNDPYDEYDYYYEDEEGGFIDLLIGIAVIIVIIVVISAIIGDTKRRRRRNNGGTVYVPVSRPRRKKNVPPPPPPMPPHPPAGPQGGMPPRPPEGRPPRQPGASRPGGGRPAKASRPTGGSAGRPSRGPSGGLSGGAGRKPSGGSLGGSRGGGLGRGGGGGSRGGGAGRRS